MLASSAIGAASLARSAAHAPDRMKSMDDVPGAYADIWRVPADSSGAPERLTDYPGDDRAATFSPDGSKLAFDSTRADGTDIWVMGADGSDARQLTFDHG